MKQGSTDDPFAEKPDENSTEEPAETVEETPPEKEETSGEDIVETESSTGQGVPGSNDEPQTLPYIYARNSVKDGRQQRPIFLRDEIEDGIPKLVDKLESNFGETVYRTDVLEAAVVVAQENPTLVEEALKEWGYGW